jgi:hypothetical protein
MSSVFEKDPIVITEEEIMEEKSTPKYGSKEWSDYVMSQFTSDELIDGNPKCAGLRRVAEELLGDIIESGPSEVYPATETNGPGRATVVFRVVFDWMNNGSYRSYSEVADVWDGNTDDPYSHHPAATASTRAEARALRKALKVNCVAAEEMSRKLGKTNSPQTVEVGAPVTAELSDKDKITGPQINFLDKKSMEQRVNVLKFVSFILNKEITNINDVSKKEASEVLNKLNDVQIGKLQRSDSWSGYIENWRN